MKVGIIGSGFSSLSAACYLAKAGADVSVFEKNEQLGGRARTYEKDGFTFDIGPSWYWMPDVFEKFFADFNKKPADFYELIRLNPAYRVYFEDGSHLEIPDNVEGIYSFFEKEEKGSAAKLKKFLKKAEFNYEVSVNGLVYKPGISPLELVTIDTVKNVHQFFTSISHDIRKLFKSKKLIKLLEFPVLFLGAKPENTPTFYSFMNYADFVLGSWYPMGGMYKVIEAMVSLAKDLGVKLHTNSPVKKIVTSSGSAKSIQVGNEEYNFDVILSGADYHHSETLLDSNLRGYSESYWKKRTFAPSALLFYAGFDCKIENINHHTLFFDEDFEIHAQEIYDHPAWPEHPLFYASFTSVTDATVAPKGKENAVFLIPLAPDLRDNEETREVYFEKIMQRLEKFTGQKLREKLLFKKSYCVDDFKADYNAYKGNAYGMANTLLQTAFLRPKINSKKVKGLYFTGQLTVPGPGVPPSLISGKIAAEQVLKEFHV